MLFESDSNLTPRDTRDKLLREGKISNADWDLANRIEIQQRLSRRYGAGDYLKALPAINRGSRFVRGRTDRIVVLPLSHIVSNHSK